MCLLNQCIASSVCICAVREFQKLKAGRRRMMYEGRHCCRHLRIEQLFEASKKADAVEAAEGLPATARKIGESEGFPGKEIPRDATPRRAGRGMKELRFPRPRVRESVQSDRNPQNLAGSVSISALCAQSSVIICNQPCPGRSATIGVYDA